MSASKKDVQTVASFCLAVLLSTANLAWAHGGGSGSAGGGPGGGNSAGHGGGSSNSVGHGSPAAFGHANHSAAVSVLASHLHSTNARTTAHNHAAHHRSVVTTRLTQNRTLRAKKKGFIDDLPPGLESRLDRGKSLPPGWKTKEGSATVVTDTDTPTNTSVPAGQEIQTDRGR